MTKIQSYFAISGKKNFPFPLHSGEKNFQFIRSELRRSPTRVEEMLAVHSKFTRINFTQKFDSILNEYSLGAHDVFNKRNTKRSRDSDLSDFMVNQADRIMESHETGIDEEKLHEIRNLVNEVNNQDLHKFQIEAMDAMIAGYIVKKFDKALKRHMNELRKILPWLPEYIANNVIVAVPRRWGKTFMVAVFYMLVALTQSDSVGLIYSVSGRTSVMMLNLIVAMIKKKQPNLPIKRNKERMEITVEGNVRLIYSYPGNPEVIILFSKFSIHFV